MKIENKFRERRKKKFSAQRASTTNGDFFFFTLIGSFCKHSSIFICYANYNVKAELH